MSKKPETVLKEWCQKRLKKLDNTWFFKTQLLSLVGIPDFIGCTDGRFWAIELKKDDKSEPTMMQLHRLEQIRKAGGLAWVSSKTNWEEVYSELEKLSKRSKS